MKKLTVARHFFEAFENAHFEAFENAHFEAFENALSAPEAIWSNLMSFDLAVTSCMAEGRVSLPPTGKGKLNAGDPTKLQGTVITSLQKPSIPQDDASQMLGGGPTEVGIKIASHFSNACCTSLHNKERSCCAFTKTDEYCWLLKTNVPAIMRRCT